MARTALTAASLPLSTGAQYFPTLPLSANSANLVTAALDVSNGNYVAIVNGKTLLLAFNSDTSAHTVTLTSVADGQNRTGDITAYSIAAAKIATFGPFTSLGWNQTSPAGLWIDGNSALILLAVITLP